MNKDNTLNKISLDELNKRFKKLAKESIKEEQKQLIGHLHSKYRIAVNNYYRRHNIQPSPYFEYPYKYFILKNNKIVFTWNKTIRFSLNIEKTLNLPIPFLPRNILRTILPCKIQKRYSIPRIQQNQIQRIIHLRMM